MIMMHPNKILKFFLFTMFSILSIAMIVDSDRFRDFTIVTMLSVATGYILAEFHNAKEF